MFESEDHREECPVWVRQALWWLYCTGRSLTCMDWNNLDRGKLGHWLKMFESEDHRVECPVWVRQALWWLYWPILDLHGLEQFGQGKDLVSG